MVNCLSGFTSNFDSPGLCSLDVIGSTITDGIAGSTTSIYGNPSLTETSSYLYGKNLYPAATANEVYK